MHHLKTVCSRAVRTNPSLVLCQITCPEWAFMYWGLVFGSRYHSNVHTAYSSFIRHCPDYKSSFVPLLNSDTRSDKLTSVYHTYFNAGLQGKVHQLSDEAIANIVATEAQQPLTAKLGVMALCLLEEQCVRRASKWSVHTQLYVLDAWMLVSGKSVWKGQYFRSLLALWHSCIGQATKINLVRMLYYLGESKEMLPSLGTIIQSRLETVAVELSVQEWALICHSLFKTKTKVNLALLKTMTNSVKVSLCSLDTAHLVSICKAMRHAQYYDEDLWNKLAFHAIKEHATFNFVESVHLLATFANANMYDPVLYSCFEVHCLTSLQQETRRMVGTRSVLKTHPSLRIRGKDLARFLWSLAHVGHAPVTTSLTDTVMNVLKKVEVEGEFVEDPRHLVDCLLSFSILGHYPHEMLSEVLKKAFLQRVACNWRSKPLQQLFCLITSVKIERPDLFSDVAEVLLATELPLLKSMYKEIKTRQGLEDLLVLMKNCCGDGRFYRCRHILPHIAIASVEMVICDSEFVSLDTGLAVRSYESSVALSDGLFRALTGKSCSESTSHSFIRSTQVGQRVSFELLDPSVCTRNGRKVLGLMQAKLRQLKILGWQPVLVTPDQVRNLLGRHVDFQKEWVKHTVATCLSKQTDMQQL